jgi:hypothetical protein
MSQVRSIQPRLAMALRVCLRVIPRLPLSLNLSMKGHRLGATASVRQGPVASRASRSPQHLVRVLRAKRLSPQRRVRVLDPVLQLAALVSLRRFQHPVVQARGLSFQLATAPQIGLALVRLIKVRKVGQRLGLSKAARVRMAHHGVAPIKPVKILRQETAKLAAILSQRLLNHSRSRKLNLAARLPTPTPAGATRLRRAAAKHLLVAVPVRLNLAAAAAASLLGLNRGGGVLNLTAPGAVEAA